MSSSLLPLNSTLITVPSTTTQRAFKTRTNPTHGSRVSCNAAPDHDHIDNKLILPEPQKLVLPNVDRRNLLVGLSSLYTAANLASLPEATATPIETPDIMIKSKCKTEVTSGFNGEDGLKNASRTRKCCPPIFGGQITDFKFPTENTVRMRWPAHNGTPEQVKKYRRAIEAMRKLPFDDPRSFKNQAKIHCAYCHGAYTESSKEIQVHNSWLFFPFHRWYLYFYERILGSLIGDPTFALPYWNWDDPDRMQIPEIFVTNKDINGKTNTLQDDVHRETRPPTAVVDLNFLGKEMNYQSIEEQKACNLSLLYRELIRTEGDLLGFFGGIYGAGSDPVPNGAESVGTVERGSHTAVHLWVGDSKQPNREDMGRFYSAGYDPLFYCHHVNVDRMWKLWNDLSPANVEPNHPDWLNASYVFYDENQKPVRVKNSDSVCLKALRYNYIEECPIENLPWRKYRPAKRNKSEQLESTKDKEPAVDEFKQPVILKNTVEVRVKRPDKKKANETLLISGIKFDCNKFVKFDVFVNDKLKNGVVPTTKDPEYAGCFAQIPHSNGDKMFMSSGARFALKELLEDTNTEDEKYVTVKLEPRVGCEDLTIDEITIINPEP